METDTSGMYARRFSRFSTWAASMVPASIRRLRPSTTASSPSANPQSRPDRVLPGALGHRQRQDAWRGATELRPRRSVPRSQSRRVGTSSLPSRFQVRLLTPRGTPGRQTRERSASSTAPFTSGTL